VQLLRRLIFLAILILTRLGGYATHIVGGEIYYDYLGSNQYRVTLKVYRDCDNGLAGFDGNSQNGGPCYLSIKNQTNPLLDTVITMGVPVISLVPNTLNNPCITTPSKCIEEGVYTQTITLNTTLYSYYLVYQRCCRNNTINNIVLPGKTGSTYYCYVPRLDLFGPNSSPRFKNLPPLFMCNNLNFSFDYSATDPDGDSLVYTFYNSFDGLSDCCASLNSNVNTNCVSPPASCPTIAPSPPYPTTIFSSTFSVLNQLPGNPSFAVNASSGQFTGTPNNLGIYLVCVGVKEYRNGNLISTHYREYQFQIVPCQVTVLAAIGNFTSQCFGNTANFVNQSVNTSTNQTYFWDFGVNGISTDTSSLFSPTYTYQDTGTYMVTLIVNPGKFCTDTIKKQVKIYPPFKINFNKNSNQCLSNNSFSFTASGSIQPQATFNWNFTSSATPVSASTQSVGGVTFNSPGTYIIELKGKQFSCRDSILDTIIVFKRPKAIIENLPDKICNPGRVFLSNGSISELPIKYSWVISDGFVSSLQNPIVYFNSVGIYTVHLTVTTTSVCADTSNATILVNVVPSPDAAFIATPSVTTIFDPFINFENRSSPDAITWEYDFKDGNTSNQSFTGNLYQTYGNYNVRLIVTNNFGCTDTSYQLVIINPEFRFWPPNAFTPGGDNLNDIFLPICVGTEEYELKIYDKWGENLFTTNDFQQGWNGKFKGQPCKQDVYVWRAEFINAVTKRKEIRFGHVTLLRNEN